MSAEIRGFGLKWAGKLFGTNTGNLYVELEKSADNYTGILRFLDDQFGLVIYDVIATYNMGIFELSGSPKATPDEVVSGTFTASGKLSDRGHIDGKWETSLGTAGTFILHPHDHSSTTLPDTKVTPPQLFTKRRNFKSVEVNKEDLIQIAERLEQEFPSAKVIVTVATSTDRASFLDDFKGTHFSSERAGSVRLFIQVPERDELNRVVSIEFGKSENFAFAQSTDEAWAIGRIERLKEEIKPFERNYALTSGIFGVSLPQILFLAMIVYIPSIENLGPRAVYVLAFVGVILTFSHIHNRLVPNALIWLKPKPPSWFSNIGIRLLSWIGALFTTVVTYLLTENFAGILEWTSKILSLTK